MSEFPSLISVWGQAKRDCLSEEAESAVFPRKPKTGAKVPFQGLSPFPGRGLACPLANSSIARATIVLFLLISFEIEVGSIPMAEAMFLSLHPWASMFAIDLRCPRRRCFQCGSIMRPPFLVAGKRWTFYITGLISASNALTDLTIRIRTVYFGVLNYAKQIGIVFTAPT